MAQHIPIEHFDHKRIRDIEKSIRAQAQLSTGFRGSLKYEKMPDDYLQADDTDVWLTTRYVGSNVTLHGRAEFEIHLNGNKINEIYLVA